MDRNHRIPFWLALVELYSDGYRYGRHGDEQLPYVFEQVVDVLLTKRRERSQSPPEHVISVCYDFQKSFAKTVCVAEQNACIYVCIQSRPALYVPFPEIHQIK